MVMLKEKAFWGSVIGFFAVCIVGTVWHFVYDWTGQNAIVGAFAPINESVWEHLKLLFFPAMLYTIGEYFFYGKKIPGFLFSRFVGILVGLIFIPVMFYAYSIPLGKSVVFLDVLIFIVAVAICYIVSFRRIQKDKDTCPSRNIAAIILFVGFSALFVGFSFFTPNAPIFKE